MLSTILKHITHNQLEKTHKADYIHTMDPIKLLIKILTYAGTIPFFLSYILAVQHTPGWIMILLTYGAVIQSFIAGMHWGVSLELARSVRVLYLCIIICLWSWVSVLLMCFPMIAILMQIVGFFALYLVDCYVVSSEAYPYKFINLRQHVTTIVIIILLAHLFLI